MKNNVCENCSSNDFEYVGNERICKFCGTKVFIETEKNSNIQSTVSINDDVAKLIEKMKTDRKNARKYLELILELDPTNRECYKYL